MSNLRDEALRFKGFDDTENRLYFCPNCGDTVKVEKEVFYGRCSTCRATVIDYTPLPHQVAFHESSALYRLLMGGYGTGKTTMCCAEVALHAIEVPKGRTLITAPKLQQVSDAILPELDKFLPPWVIVEKKKSPTPYYKLRNGHEIVVYASNDENNLRSLNLTMFYMEEASAIDVTVFFQLQTRLRNLVAIKKNKFGIPIEDKRCGIVASNPEQGWLVDNFLLHANKMFASQSVDVAPYKLLAKKPERAYHAFLSSSRDNMYLPRGFISNLCAGKSPMWVRKYIDCQLEIRQGAVYPDFVNNLVPDFPIPNTWKRIAGFDKGWKDETAMLFGAIDPKDGTVYVYKEYYQAQKPISYHAEQIREFMEGLPMYNHIQADPSVLHSNDRDGRSYQEYFHKISNIWLEPAKNSISIGLDKTRDYMYCGKLKFFQSLVYTKEEAFNYVYSDKDVATKEELPIDKKNHLMDALRYMIMALPQNPFEMIKISSPFIDRNDVDWFWRSESLGKKDSGVFRARGFDHEQ